MTATGHRGVMAGTAPEAEVRSPAANGAERSGARVSAQVCARAHDPERPGHLVAVLARVVRYLGLFLISHRGRRCRTRSD